jgi:hypothetical protein
MVDKVKKTGKAGQFEIDTEDGMLVGSNGDATVSLFVSEGGKVFRRRSERQPEGLPVAGSLRPKVTALAEEMLARGDMPAAEIIDKLQDLAKQAKPPRVERIEWLVAELDGVRAYFDGANVILTKQDLQY